MVETINYLANLNVVNKTKKCHDFTVIFPVFSKMHRYFAAFYRAFLTALMMAITCASLAPRG